MEQYGKQTERKARVMEKLDLPVDLVTDLPRMEMTGDREFYMEHHRGILSYSTETVDINGGALMVRLTGQNLQLVAMTESELRVCGTIEKMELMR
ncbi:MAG: YabP/YqfC family sporulation protein [Oscillibacter sp.]|nr:YabP/YqfC family sporulation protein [Oscillibacter sp.]